MTTMIDLRTLTKEQLIQLVLVRGQALKSYWKAERDLVDKLNDPECPDSEIDNHLKAKDTIALELMLAEENIIGGSGQTAN